MFFQSSSSRAKDSEDSGDLVNVLPDVEVFFHKPQEEFDESGETLFWDEKKDKIWADGWFWWKRFAGCIPHDYPHGPFSSEKEAKKDMLKKFKGAVEA